MPNVEYSPLRHDSHLDRSDEGDDPALQGSHAVCSELAIRPGSSQRVHLAPSVRTVPGLHFVHEFLSLLSELQSPPLAVHSVPGSHTKGRVHDVWSAETEFGFLHSWQVPNALKKSFSHLAHPVRLALGPVPAEHGEHVVC